MEPREIQRWKLPGYAAYAHVEPFPWAWAALWFSWGLAVAGFVVWGDAAYAVAGCFVAWGTLMGCFGWRALTVGSAVVHDWAKSHYTDPNVEMAAMREFVDTLDSAREQGEFDEESFEVPDTPAQRRWLHEELFTAFFSIPWFMGLTHGAGFGGLGGAVLALVPSVDSSVTAGAIYGALAGAVTATSLSAVFFALLPSPKDTLPAAWSLKQRMLLIVSPLLAVPALVEAAALWWQWYAQGQSGTRTLGDV